MPFIPFINTKCLIKAKHQIRICDKNIVLDTTMEYILRIVTNRSHNNKNTDCNYSVFKFF